MPRWDRTEWSKLAMVYERNVYNRNNNPALSYIIFDLWGFDL